MRSTVQDAKLLRWLFDASSVAFGLRQGVAPVFPDGAAASVAGRNGALLLPWLSRLELRFPGSVPANLIERGQPASIFVAARNLMLLGDFRPVAESLEEHGVRWTALKGLDHLARFLPGPEWRAMADVDILVHSDDLEMALRLLGERGFTESRGLAVPILAPAVSVSNGGAFIDVHRRLVRGGCDRVPPDAFVSDTTLVSFEGVPVRLPQPGDALAASALLLAKDLFMARSTNPCRVVELALLAEIAGDGAIARQGDRLRAWGIGRFFDRSLELADWVRGRGARPVWLEDGFGDPARYVGPEINRWRYMFKCAALQDSPTNAARFLLNNLAGKIRALQAGLPITDPGSGAQA